MKKDQIKSKSEYKIMGFTLEKMLSHAYGLGRMDQKYQPENIGGKLRKESIHEVSKEYNWAFFEIIEK